MGYMRNLSQYALDRTIALEVAANNAKTLAQANNYSLDQFFKDSLKLWMDGIDAWWGVIPYVPLEAVPPTFKTVGASAGFFSEFVDPVPYPSGAVLLNTGLIPLNGGKAAGAITSTLQVDGTLLLDIPALAGQKAGELYQNVTYYADASPKYHAIAILLLSVI